MNVQEELTLQRLVDGELSEQDRAAYLESIQNEPGQWRSVALAFVENQVWRAAAIQSSEAAETSRLGSLPDHLPLDRTRRTSWWQVSGPRLMLTAAATLFALALIVRFGDPGGTSGRFAVPAGEERPTTPEPIPQTVSTEPYLLKIDDVEVPVYDMFDRFEAELGNTDFEIDPAIQHKLWEAGYRVKPDVKFISGQIPDGRRFLVPVHSWRVQSFVQ